MRALRAGSHERCGDRRDLELGNGAAFERSALFSRVLTLAEKTHRQGDARALSSADLLKSPKITRKLTTDWFANRVNDRYERCLRRSARTVTPERRWDLQNGRGAESRHFPVCATMEGCAASTPRVRRGVSGCKLSVISFGAAGGDNLVSICAPPRRSASPMNPAFPCIPQRIERRALITLRARVLMLAGVSLSPALGLDVVPVDAGAGRLCKSCGPRMNTDSEVASPDVADGLFVDDEPNILRALRRVFRSQGYRLHTAESASEGLKLLEREVVDVVVSDMRMPEISGAQFLGEVRLRWPDTVRILLTGHSDVDSTVAAINDGGIYRYVAKPWEERDIQLLVRGAIERKALEREKVRLEKLARRQNEELRDLNSTLATKVLARTQDLQAALGSLS